MKVTPNIYISMHLKIAIDVLFFLDLCIIAGNVINTPVYRRR